MQKKHAALTRLALVEMTFAIAPLVMLLLFFILTLSDGAPQLIPSDNNLAIITGHFMINLIVGGLSIWAIKNYLSKQKELHKYSRIALWIQGGWIFLTLIPLLLILLSETNRKAL